MPPRVAPIAVGDQDVRAASDAVGLITEVAQALPRNPNEALLLQSLFTPAGRAGRVVRLRQPVAARLAAEQGLR